MGSFTATTASPNSMRYSFCMASSISRTPSAFSSLGSSMTNKSDMDRPRRACDRIGFLKPVLPGALGASRLRICISQDLYFSGFVFLEAREAAFTKLRKGDPSTLLLHPRSSEGGVCPQQLLILLAFDHVVPRVPSLRHIARVGYRSMLH